MTVNAVLRRSSEFTTSKVNVFLVIVRILAPYCGLTSANILLSL